MTTESEIRDGVQAADEHGQVQRHPRQRRPWSAPTLHTLQANEAETGQNSTTDEESTFS